ncbi:UDP-N-acetylmuramoylalanyl-D-glutamate--2,6-diaminopimelate ligase [Leuconostocaceae bacterium R-53105]|uniref:UDP-N-acetylmuramoylalanyl-D-glutamate--2, 6-diaminopimelate ligase n=2 Tax=Convivina intestini TaxID=1505726 RepID=A0A2U1DEL3_9LACO|nr:UDP-N-acetylmuramoylalanyl-D-glutamate--2,6-diaminopimelate ligase [Convivina intestini]CAH1851453.1 UDP-N-acetylmuramoyl-L-alanyl-D-glutamate--L-lysine ligase [Convivina intestini]CAH1853046.1 UDP-N-acetylmuramoyl-L-alanyl-D-glutamate--L-lysine ligase [Convivina intestini]SDB80888.1 UDP-N-acetylmuramoylalanyl-D-glutamate--2,6-diaminopimelate ligase [Leuconostocaceae bacterium R-53105]
MICYNIGMQLTSQKITQLLNQHQLLKDAPQGNNLLFEFLHYDSRQVRPDTLFVVKGAFKAEYLQGIAGVRALVTEKPLEWDGPQWIVTDSQKALAVLSMAYFDYPQKQLWIGAFTGTKGKTTAAYFAYYMLKAATGNKTALFSTVDRITGPTAQDRHKSDLTTPESYELFKDMRRAVDNGMTHLVMEVSSQAYLRNRVYGLDYQVGAFLNISPDHIGPNEHPTFEDYLAHKLMLFDHSKQVIVNAESDHLEQIMKRAQENHDHVYTYGAGGEFTYLSHESAIHESRFTVNACSLTEMEGDYRLNVPGDFNESNAMAALIMVALAGAKHGDMVQGLDQVVIPGRMLSLPIAGHGVTFVDYAHNYASMSALLSFAQDQYPEGKVIVVVGSPGNKGVSRRADFGKVISKLADEVYLTADDPQYEDPQAIAQAIAQHITNPHVKIHYQMDRIKAIHTAIDEAGPEDIVVVAGKGEDPYQKINGQDVPYIGDYAVVVAYQKQEAQ